MSTEPYTITHYKSDKSDSKDLLNLSLMVDNEEFTFCIFNAEYNELLELCRVKTNPGMLHSLSNIDRITFLVNNYQLAGKKFKNVNISLLNTDFTILPEAFALNESSKEILEFSSGKNSKNTYTNQFNNLSFSYFVESDVIQFLEKSFKNASIHHAGSISINLLFNNRSLKKCDLFLNFNEGIFELLAKQNNKLQYYNVFTYESKEDVMYFLLFMMEQFEIDANKVKLMVAGQIEVESELYKSLKKYIKHVDFVINDNKINNKLTDLKIPNHFYFILLNQHLCEL